MSNSATPPAHALAYLQTIEMDDGYTFHQIPCEICGSDDLEVIHENIDLGKSRFGKLPVHGCKQCGYIFHSERFEERFYRDFYEKHYRSILFGRTTPEKAFVADQVHRGRQLYDSIAKYIPKAGRMLDVGGSCGGLMVGFREKGWDVYGTDPDRGFAEFGRDRLKLPVDCMYAEDMQLEPESIDLIIITGSLEHVYDLKKVLNICRNASAPDALIVVEGRALGFCQIEGCFTHTHRRYFDRASLPLALAHYGWKPEVVTGELLSGQSRPGGVFCIARAGEKEHNPTSEWRHSDINAHFKSVREKTAKKLPLTLRGSSVMDDKID